VLEVVVKPEEKGEGETTAVILTEAWRPKDL